VGSFNNELATWSLAIVDCWHSIVLAVAYNSYDEIKTQFDAAASKPEVTSSFLELASRI
jgi:hypothetical protein